jgi:LysM repeat protein
MHKKTVALVVSFVLLAVVLSGCKMPASTAPEPLDEIAMTTPIVIITEEPETSIEELGEVLVTEEPIAPEETEEDQDFFAPPTATLEPTIMVPTVTRPAQYTLREGEFPFCIARRFNVDPADLLSLNGLGPNTLLEPGTTLQIPQTGTWAGEGRVLNPHPTTHTVLAGESIYSIACFYGDVSPEAIIAVNQLEEPYDLTAGQTLKIP